MRAWALALLFLVPLASADHVFSHRVVVEGRLVASNGAPIAGRQVEVESTGERLSEGCREAQRPVTDAKGDFYFCYHRHELGPNGVVTVRSGNVSATRPLDTQLRRMVFFLMDHDEVAVAPEGWNSTFDVDGRVWSPGLTRLDGVDVSGLAMGGEVVNVTIKGRGGTGSSYDMRTTSYGDYFATVRLVPGERVEDLTLQVTSRGRTLEGSLDPIFHRSLVDVVLADEVFVLPPGTASGPVSVTLVMGMGIAAWIAVLVVKRRS